MLKYITSCLTTCLQVTYVTIRGKCFTDQTSCIYLIEVDGCCDRSSLTYSFIATNRNEPPPCAICYQVIIKLLAWTPSMARHRRRFGEIALTPVFYRRHL